LLRSPVNAIFYWFWEGAAIMRRFVFAIAALMLAAPAFADDDKVIDVDVPMQQGGVVHLRITVTVTPETAATVTPEPDTDTDTDALLSDSEQRYERDRMQLAREWSGDKQKLDALIKGRRLALPPATWSDKEKLDALINGGPLLPQ
jgi:hypothetical protein